jgi:ribosomal protein S19
LGWERRIAEGKGWYVWLRGREAKVENEERLLKTWVMNDITWSDMIGSDVMAYDGIV